MLRARSILVPLVWSLTIGTSPVPARRPLPGTLIPVLARICHDVTLASQAARGL
jgi:hypothetical protein